MSKDKINNGDDLYIIAEVKSYDVEIIGYVADKAKAHNDVRELNELHPGRKFIVSEASSLSGQTVTPGLWEGHAVFSATGMGNGTVALNYALTDIDFIPSSISEISYYSPTDSGHPEVKIWCNEHDGIFERYRMTPVGRHRDDKDQYVYVGKPGNVKEVDEGLLLDTLNCLTFLAQNGYDLDKRLMKAFVKLSVRGPQSALKDKLDSILNTYREQNPGHYLVCTNCRNKG